MVRHSFSLDGVNCEVYGIVCSGHNTYNAPERDIESIDIPGRNGALTIDNGRWKNIKVIYPASIVRGFQQAAQSARAWLCAASGYRRLEDDYNPDTYRMARFVAGLNFEMTPANDCGEVDITFDCMPQRWLKSGETAVSVASGEFVNNPTLFDALPIITVTGSGEGVLVINGQTVDIDEIDGSITLDCEAQRAYSGAEARDGDVTGAYPVLKPGANSVQYSGGITAVEIVPRWWTL